MKYICINTFLLREKNGTAILTSLNIIPDSGNYIMFFKNRSHGSLEK